MVALSKAVNFKKFSVNVEFDGFYKIQVNDSDDFNVSDLTLLVAIQKEMGEHFLPTLVLCSENATTDMELLNAISKNSLNPYSKADAFVIHSLPQKILANFYLKISKPERPTKFFSNKENALEWLREFM